ncbi:MAG: head GIN domain-containing protein [Planctomycetota bacterium]
MNRRIVHLGLALCLTFASSGCIIAIGVDSDGDWAESSWWDSKGVSGSGVEKVETRAVADFKRIQIACSADLSVRIGSPTAVTVSGDDNIVPHLQTEVQNGVLVIKMEEGGYRHRRGLRVTATVPALEGVSVSGSSDVDVSGVSGRSLDLAVAGSGDITASGEVDALSVSVSGSGDLRLFGLKARQATVQIAGSGDVTVHAVEALSAAVSGSGDVRYRGEPTVTKSVAGSGSVSRADS